MAVSLYKISNLLVQLLRVHNRVSLPGVGAFKTEYKPATLIKGGKAMAPPTKVVIFRIEEVWNDGLLEKEWAIDAKVSLDEAKQQLKEFTEELQVSLNNGKRIEFPDFGILRITADNEYLFEKDEDLNLLPDSFVLNDINLTAVEHSQIEEIPIQINTPIPAPQKNPVIKPIIPNTTDKINKSTMEQSKTNRNIILVAAIIFLAAVGLALYMMYDRFYKQNPNVVETLSPTVTSAPIIEEPQQQPAVVAQYNEPAPVEKKETVRRKISRNREYHVILGAYSDRLTAQTVMNDQIDMGVCNCVLIQTSGKKPYKISAFRYSSVNEAKEMLEGFKRTDAEYLDAWVEKF